MKKYYTSCFLNGKKVSVNYCKNNFKGFSKTQEKLKSLAFLPGSSVTQNCNLSNGNKLTIRVKNKIKNNIFE